MTTYPADLVRNVTLLVAGTFFMEMLDGTIVATALPQIAADMRVDVISADLGMTAYLISLAVFIPIGGWLARRFDAKVVFIGAIALFTVSSLLCGLCHGLWSFAAARVLQGAGGAAMVPVGRLVAIRLSPREQLTRTIGTIVWPALIAPVVAPPLGGLLVTYLSWRWIFLLNVPVGLVALGLAWRLVPRGILEEHARRLDVFGFVLSGAAMGLTIYGINALSAGRELVAAAAALAVGLGLAFGCVRHLHRHQHPLIDLFALSIPTFAVVAQGGSLLRIAIGSMPFLLPLLFQVGFGLDALTAGGLVMFVFAGNLAMKVLTTPVLSRFGFKRVMLISGCLASVSIACCALLTPRTPHGVIAAVLFAGGLARSMQFTCLATIQFVDIPNNRMADANTLASILQQLMIGLGVVAGAGLLNIAQLLGGSSTSAPDLGDFRFAFLSIAILALVGLIDTLRLPEGAGDRKA